MAFFFFFLLGFLRWPNDKTNKRRCFARSGHAWNQRKRLWVHLFCFYVWWTIGRLASVSLSFLSFSVAVFCPSLQGQLQPPCFFTLLTEFIHPSIHRLRRSKWKCGNNLHLPKGESESSVWSYQFLMTFRSFLEVGLSYGKTYACNCILCSFLVGISRREQVTTIFWSFRDPSWKHDSTAHDKIARVKSARRHNGTATIQHGTK